MSVIATSRSSNGGVKGWYMCVEDGDRSSAHHRRVSVCTFIVLTAHPRAHHEISGHEVNLVSLVLPEEFVGNRISGIPIVASSTSYSTHLRL